MKTASLPLRIADRIFWGMASLKFAVWNIAGLAVACAVATVLESIYDTPTAQYYVYRSVWFYGLLLAFGLNILFVALSRWPWKRHHAAFLLAHLGILLLLIGSFITYRHGLDGSMRLEEGRSSNVVEIDQPMLLLFENDRVDEVPVRWTPPVAKFRPIEVPEYGLTVQEFMTHADGRVDFLPADPADGDPAEPAVRLLLEGGPMRIRQDFWLWAGDPAWAIAQAGPARLQLGKTAGAPAPAPAEGPVFTVTPQPNGDLAWESKASDGRTRRGRLPAAGIVGAKIEPGWAGDLRIEVQQYLPRATAKTVYTPSRNQYGMQAPPSAIRVVAGEGGKQADLWLGLGDRASLQFQGRQIGLAYFPRRVQLPFELKLERFQIDHYEGTRDPSQYSSRVSVVDARPELGGGAATEDERAEALRNGGGPLAEGQRLISMNEPLVHDGITFYQASYEDAQPRPKVSIFSVNRDPGRGLKYWGSLLLVLGSTLLFYQKIRKQKKTGAPARAAAPGTEVTA